MERDGEGWNKLMDIQNKGRNRQQMDTVDEEKRERKLKEQINALFTNADVLTKDKLSELKSKIDQATDELEIIAISELTPKNYSRTLSIEDIDCYTIDHLNSIDSNEGRGMGLYLRDTLRYNLVTPTTNFEELIIVQLNLINPFKEAMTAQLKTIIASIHLSTL